MKKALLGTVYFLACILPVHAQTLYGTTFGTVGITANGGNGTIDSSHRQASKYYYPR